MLKNCTRTKFLIVLICAIYLCLPALGKTIPERHVDKVDSQLTDRHRNEILFNEGKEPEVNEPGDDGTGEDGNKDPDSKENKKPDDKQEPEKEGLCDDGQKGFIACSKQHKNCHTTEEDNTEDGEKYKCEGCLKGFVEDDKNCIHICTEGQAGFKACEEKHKICINTTEGDMYKCEGCMKGFVVDGEGNCVVDHCTEGKDGFLNCTAKNMKCVVDLNKSPFFNCDGCLDGFDLAGNDCVDLCSKTKEGDEECGQLKRVCKPIKSKPFFECGKCLNDLVDNGKECVNPCQEDQKGGKECKTKNRICKFDLAKNYTCGECENGPFIEVNGSCVDGCSYKVKGEKTWNALCEEKNIKCGQNKNKTAVTCYCADTTQLFNPEKEVCSAPCNEEDGIGYSDCNMKGRNCDDNKNGTYICGDCSNTTLIIHEEFCVEPCAENYPGFVDCQKNKNRLCVPEETKDKKYDCGRCIKNHIEKGEKCIDPCEEIAKDEKTWTKQCEDIKGKCILNNDESGATCKCDESDKFFDIKNKECSVPCEHLYEDGSNDTWSKICGNANAKCENDFKNEEAICKCLDANRAFDKTKLECYDPCANGTEGFITCRDKMRECLFKEDEQSFFDCGDCIDGYHDKNGTCIEIDPCDDTPCENGGTCTRIDRATYKCDCTKYWYGDNCEHEELCEGKNPCKDGTCEVDKNHHTYKCICEGKQYYNHIDETCDVLDKCVDVTCKSFEECLEGKCTCVEGFEKKEAECIMTAKMCKDLCGDNAKCSITPDFTVIECSCNDGYYLDIHSSKPECKSSKCVAPFHPCDQLCKMDGENETCSCETGFELKSDGKKCELKKDHECNSTQCENGACVKNGDKEVCVCNKGYSGEGGECVDICSIENDKIVQQLCPNGCTRDENGEIKCNCTGIYVQAEDGVSCKRKNLCEKGEDGDKDCSSKNAKCRVIVKDPFYNCYCPSYLLDINGTCSDSCSTDKVNECAETTRTCQLIKSTSSEQALEITSSEQVLEITSLEQPKEVCRCQLSMVYDETNNRCHFDENSFFVTFIMKSPIPQNKMAQAPPNVNMYPIQEAMTTMYGDYLKDIDLVECSPKDGNLECTIMLTLEKDSGNIRRRILLNDTCKDLDNDDDKGYCVLPPKLIVLRSSLNNNKLKKDVCNEALRDKFCPTVSNDCTDEETGYNCLCKEGFKSVTTFMLGGEEKYKYETCEDVDECTENRCWKNSKCENTIGSFRCVCDKNYFLTETKDKCQDYCDPSPCKNSGTCNYAESSFQCECSKGYTGMLCEKEDKFLQKANTNMIVIGAVLGSVLLISFIVIIVLIRKIKRSKDEDEYDTQMDDYGRNYENVKGLGDRERAVKRDRLGKQGYDNPAMS